MIVRNYPTGKSLHRLTQQEWKEISQNAMRVSFAVNREPTEEDCDNAFLLTDENETPMAFATLKKRRGNVAYLAFGGVFPVYQGKNIATEYLDALLGFLSMYKAIVVRIQVSNIIMLRLALKYDFIPTGFFTEDTLHFLELTRRK